MKFWNKSVWIWLWLNIRIFMLGYHTHIKNIKWWQTNYFVSKLNIIQKDYLFFLNNWSIILRWLYISINNNGILDNKCTYLNYRVLLKWWNCQWILELKRSFSLHDRIPLYLLCTKQKYFCISSLNFLSIKEEKLVIHMLYTWVSHGHHMGIAWTPNGYIWTPHVAKHGSHMIITWVTHGYHMPIVWISHDYHMVITWVSHGHYMLTAWESHGIIRTFS